MMRLWAALTRYLLNASMCSLQYRSMGTGGQAPHRQKPNKISMLYVKCRDMLLRSRPSGDLGLGKDLEHGGRVDTVHILFSLETP